MRSMAVQRVLAGVYVAALAGVALWPTPVDSRLDVVGFWPVRVLASVVGLTAEQAYAVAEFGANVVMFVPLGWFAVVLLRLRWWQSALLGAGVSAAVEVGQAVLRPERFATVVDVVANGSGALLGALVAAVAYGQLRRGSGRRRSG